MPNFGWAYAVSKDGTHFEKKGLIGIGNLTGVEDCHVVHDPDSGLYYMYYWYGWHMFYANFVQPHCPNSYTRYATSKDGIHWQARNKRIIKGHDAEVLRVADDLYLMFYSPQNHFDRKDCDVRVAIYNGRLPDLISMHSHLKEENPMSLIGKTLTVNIDNESSVYIFREDGEVIIIPDGVADEAFNAYYEQDDENVHILGEGLKLKGTYDGETLKLTE